MPSNETLATIREHIVTNLLGRTDLDLTEHTRLIDEGYLTSLQALELVAFLEERFGVAIAPEELSEENFATLGSIAALVESKGA